MTTIVYKDGVLATDTLVVVTNNSEDPGMTDKIRTVMPPSLRVRRAILPSGGKLVMSEESDWVFGVSCDSPGGFDRVRYILSQVTVGDWTDAAFIDALAGETLDPATSIIGVHRETLEVCFYKRRTNKGDDASIFRRGLKPDRPYALGSGSWEAMMSMTAKNCDAKRAVQLACVNDLTSGGGVYWLDVQSGKDGTLSCPRNPSPEQQDMMH
ncbi:MAG: hypothetical protein HQL54_11850 [Magnetococcales bacterium]|nr:hypothetical protein [Magnetococcales bacterium]